MPVQAPDAAIGPGWFRIAQLVTSTLYRLAVEVDESITCIDCGELAHRLSYPPEDGNWLPGDIVNYRCTGCGDRWDIEVPEEEDGR